MTATLHELLQPQIIMGVISRIKKSQSRLSKWLGFQPTRFDPEKPSLSGPNSKESYGRNFSWRIYDSSRVPAMGRAPGTGPATIRRNPIGVVQGTYARAHEKVQLLYEDLGNLSPMVGPNSVIDPSGQNYIAQQENIIGQHFNNFINVMTAGLIRGQFYLQFAGDNMLPVLTQPAATVAYQTLNYQVPSGNLSQLNMLGTGSIIDKKWSDPTSNILKHIFQIKSAEEQLTGDIIQHAWLSGPTWYWLVTNTEIRNVGGSAATPMAEFERIDDTDFDGNPMGVYMARLKAEPTITWHISDETLAIGGNALDPTWAGGTASLVKITPDGVVFMCPEVSQDWVQLGYGSEPVVENPGQPGVQRAGYYFWHEYVTQPSAVELIGLLNAVPQLFVPKSILYANVDF